MSKRGIPSFLQGPAYYAIRGVLSAMLTGDIGANLRRARELARVYSRFEPTRVRRTMENLAVAFPEMPEEERRAYAVHAYEHLFMLGVEMAHTPRLFSRDSWAEHVRLGSLNPAVRQMVSGRPCILITGHCGNWELLGYTLALLGFGIHALYRPLDLPALDSWVRQTRERRGLVLMDKFGAAQAIPRLMHKGALVGFIADQNAGDRGLFVPFFNRLASSYKSIGLMAIHHDAPIVCGQARRLVSWREGGGVTDEEELRNAVGYEGYSHEPFRYHIDVNDVIMPEEWKSQPDPLFYVSARYRRALEHMVRRAPEQNLWLHRYWKSRPRHEHMGKPLPRSLENKIRALPWTTDQDVERIKDWSLRDAREIANRPPKPSVVAGLSASPTVKPATVPAES